MGKIIEILETERKRPTAQDWDVVHMYKTGQFYTAYDWSAWIISVISYTDAVRMQTKDRHPLAVTRIKIATSEQTFCKVGFPFKSIEKFCPLRQNVDDLKGSNPAKLYRSINSMLGVMSHFDAHRLSRELFCVEPFLKHGYFADDMTCYYLHR